MHGPWCYGYCWLLLVRHAHSAAESVLPSSACTVIYGVMSHVHISNTPSSTNVIVELDGLLQASSTIIADTSNRDNLICKCCKKMNVLSTDREMITIPICDWDIIVFLRSQSGEIGSSISASLSPCSAVQIKVIFNMRGMPQNTQLNIKQCSITYVFV